MWEMVLFVCQQQPVIKPTTRTRFMPFNRRANKISIKTGKISVYFIRSIGFLFYFLSLCYFTPAAVRFNFFYVQCEQAKSTRIYLRRFKLNSHCGNSWSSVTLFLPSRKEI